MLDMIAYVLPRLMPLCLVILILITIGFTLCLIGCVVVTWAINSVHAEDKNAYK